MTELLSLSVGDVLYRTRGRDWDYCFVLQPKPLLREGWYALHRRIFSNVEPGREPLLLRGSLGIGTGVPFFATAFTDAVRRDGQGRPIAHYVTWLGSVAESAPGQSFGAPFVEAVAPALTAIFELVPSELQSEREAPLDACLRARFSAALPATLKLRCPERAPIRWLGALAV